MRKGKDTKGNEKEKKKGQNRQPSTNSQGPKIPDEKISMPEEQRAGREKKGSLAKTVPTGPQSFQKKRRASIAANEVEGRKKPRIKKCKTGGGGGRNLTLGRSEENRANALGGNKKTMKRNFLLFEALMILDDAFGGGDFGRRGGGGGGQDWSIPVGGSETKSNISHASKGMGWRIARQ